MQHGKAHQSLKEDCLEKNYPHEIKNLVTEKRKMRRKWQRTRNPEFKTCLNRLTKELNQEIQQIQNETFTKYLTDLTADKSTDYSLWKSTKNLKRPITQSPPLKMTHDKWAKSNTQKAQLFSEHLANIFTVNPSSILTLPSIHTTYDEEIPPISPVEVEEEIQKLAIKKASGYDLLTAEVLKELPHPVVIRLSNILNACFHFRYVPTLWKVSDVIMIPKPGKPPNEVTSYRPISLLPTLSKLFEKLFLRRLKPIIERNNLIPSHQFGFRDHHSTIDQVYRITNVIESALEKRQVCSAVFLDISQEFDKVWHLGLLYKLRCHLPHTVIY